MIVFDKLQSANSRNTCCIVYGVGSPYVHDVFESLSRLNWVVTAFIDNLGTVTDLDGLGPLIKTDSIREEWRRLPVVVPLLTPGYRKKVRVEVEGLGFREFATVVDPTAVIASTSSFGRGTLVNAGVIVGAKTNTGAFVVINRGASIGHHVQIEDYVSTGPSCVICGCCHIGHGAFVGGGAVISPKLAVGANSIVGAGAVVVKDVPANSVVVGNPARVIRTDVSGYNDVST
jgi:sugar O-acyltransferase (sialic acid O-acetyltransferase NeuD family)